MTKWLITLPGSHTFEDTMLELSVILPFCFALPSPCSPRVAVDPQVAVAYDGEGEEKKRRGGEGKEDSCIRLPWSIVDCPLPRLSYQKTYVPLPFPFPSTTKYMGVGGRRKACRRLSRGEEGRWREGVGRQGGREGRGAWLREMSMLHHEARWPSSSPSSQPPPLMAP